MTSELYNLYIEKAKNDKDNYITYLEYCKDILLKDIINPSNFGLIGIQQDNIIEGCFVENDVDDEFKIYDLFKKVKSLKIPILEELNDTQFIIMTSMIYCKNVYFYNISKDENIFIKNIPVSDINYIINRVNKIFNESQNKYKLFFHMYQTVFGDI